MKKKGYVYVLSNECIVSREGRPVLKVGFTTNLPRRLGTLNTSVPENFKVVALFETNRYRDLEKIAKGYMNESIRTQDGSLTEFFDKDLKYVVDRIRKCAAHVRIKIVKRDGSKYVGRSSSAIRNNLRGVKLKVKKVTKSNGNAWDNPTQLARAILKKFDPSKSDGHVRQLLMKKAACKAGLWRNRLERIGLTFDKNGFVKDWRKAKPRF